MTEEKASIGTIRSEIDQLDQDIQALIVRRAECAAAIAVAKQQEADSSESKPEPVYYRPEREAAVLRGICERNTGPLSKESMSRLFREIMSACLVLEQPMRIAYLVPEGTFTESATL